MRFNPVEFGFALASSLLFIIVIFVPLAWCFGFLWETIIEWKIAPADPVYWNKGGRAIIAVIVIWGISQALENAKNRVV